MEKKCWHQYYSSDTPNDINPDKYASINEILVESFERYSDKVAYTCMGSKITYAQVDRLSKKFAAYLQNHTGLQPGDHIAIQLPNVLQYPIVLFGILRAGMVVVNTNPLYTEREMKHQFKDAGVKAIVILSNFAAKLENIKRETEIRHIILTELGDMLGTIKGFIVNLVVRHMKKMVPLFSLPTALSLKKVLDLGDANKYAPVPLTGKSLAFLQYTGGTTGISKGAMLTHRNIVANLEMAVVGIGKELKEGEELVITALPLYHIFALTVNCLMMVKIGGRNVLITNPRDIDGFVKELSKYAFSIISGVNTLYNM